MACAAAQRRGKSVEVVVDSALLCDPERSRGALGDVVQRVLQTRRILRPLGADNGWMVGHGRQLPLTRELPKSESITSRLIGEPELSAWVQESLTIQSASRGRLIAAPTPDIAGFRRKAPHTQRFAG